jgi:chorismate lyase/3-hydroxybenzoate synthase
MSDEYSQSAPVSSTMSILEDGQRSCGYSGVPDLDGDGSHPQPEASQAMSSVMTNPPRWVRELMNGHDAEWQPVTTEIAVRTVDAGMYALVSAVVGNAVSLDADQLEHQTSKVYELIGNRLCTCNSGHPVRVWNFIPGILEPLGDLKHRYMAFNAGRFRAYASWFEGADAFDRAVPTASGVGHSHQDLVVHCLAAQMPGQPIENPRQVPSYRYSSRWGPLPPCFARATRIEMAANGHPWLLVGGTASVRGEETVYPDDLAGQAEETLQNLTALVRSGLDGSAGVCECRRFLHTTSKGSMARQ